MFYYLYEIRNKLNGMIYIGVHKTNDMNDGYMGSGKVIINAINKHGIENFTKAIIEYFKTSEEMFAREKEIVTDDFLLREDVYNLRRGGTGGWDYINNNGFNDRSGMIHTTESKIKMSHIPSDEERKTKSNNLIGKVLNLNIKNKGETHPSYGQIRSVETKKKIAESVSKSWEKRNKTHPNWGKNLRVCGEKHPTFGTMWITNEIESVKIKKTDPIPDGWRKGRKMHPSYNGITSVCQTENSGS